MDIELAMRYAPYIYFDEAEPFFPIKVGYTIFRETKLSPSFPRQIRMDNPCIDYVIEYAIYWDFDIEHLYDLEHIWIYIDTKGQIIDCEASFHGKYLKGLLTDESNIEQGTHIRLYAQPGKHAFLPKGELFELVPDLRKATFEYAGSGGLCVSQVLQERCASNDGINKMIKDYLQLFKFKPTMVFEKYKIPVELLVPWEELYQEIPQLVEEKLKEINEFMNHMGNFECDSIS
jgi:hypothetical protein